MRKAKRPQHIAPINPIPSGQIELVKTATEWARLILRIIIALFFLCVIGGCLIIGIKQLLNGDKETGMKLIGLSLTHMGSAVGGVIVFKWIFD